MRSLRRTAWTCASLLGLIALASSSALAGAPLPAVDLTARATPAVRTFTDEDGLPQNTVNALTYGADGVLWLATQEGLATYDGSAFRAVSLPEGAGSQWADDLATLSDGSIAVGMHSDGVWILAPGRSEHLTADRGLPDNAVRGLAAVGAESELWIGTAHGLAVRGRDGSIAKPAGAPIGDEAIQSVASGGRDRAVLGVATAKTIALRVNGAWRTFPLGEGVLPGNVVHAIAFGADAARDVAIGFEQGAGAFHFDGDAWRKIDGITCNDVDALTPPASTWWLAAACGVFRVEGDHATAIGVSDPPLRDVRSLLVSPPEDGPPALWVGTSAGGLARMATAGWRALTPKSSPLQTAIYAFGWSQAVDASWQTWIGSESGLSMYDGHDWHEVPLPNADSYVNAILDAHGDSARGLWVATFGGLSRRRDDGTWAMFTEAQGLPSHVVLSLAEVTGASGQPELLAGLRRGLARFDGTRWETLTPTTAPGAPVDKEVTSITESPGPAGRRLVWVATSDAGLFRRDGATWTHVEGGTPAGLGKEILHVHAASWPGDRPRVFVSTGEHGVAWFDPREESPKWFGLSTKSTPSLPDDVISGTQQDRFGRIYVFTNRGVARLTPHDVPDVVDVEVFTAEDGLPSAECNTGASAVDPLGRVWAGTVAGAAVLEPTTHDADRTPKRLLLRSTHLFDRDVDLGKRRELAYDESTLAFEFALLDFHRERDTRYRTQLVGFESDPSAWTPDAKVRYTSLPAGSYELRVWGRDYAGNVSDPRVVPFAIRTAPWLAWWAWIAYASAGFALIGLGVRARTAQVERRAKELSERVTERTAELAKRNAELAASIRELGHKNTELLESQRRADRIFSAFADVLPGTLLDGKYRIQEKIGSGGFAVVFRAQQESLQRAVAVKIFRPEPGNDSALALERFQREGMAASRVNHPNAVQVFDSGISAEGIPYLVMELLEGRSLGTELEGEKRMTARRAIEIAIPIAGALAAAHEAGLIHRDIKPDNVFLQSTKDGEVVKVLDFGIAKLLQGEDDEDTSAHTASAALIGTPRYMAPERLMHGTYDDKSDVYSLGVILYEMISGRLPWRESSGHIMTVITKIVTGEVVPLQELGVPGPLAEVVMRALALEAPDRPAARELQQRLVALQGTLSEKDLGAIFGAA